MASYQLGYQLCEVIIMANWLAYWQPSNADAAEEGATGGQESVVR
jgi:hypothetical protein